MFEQINTKEEKENMIKLPDDFECVFKKDPDSLVPKVEALIEDLNIRIKEGLRYTKGKGRKKLFNGLIVEFEQLIKDRENGEEEKSINIEGKVLNSINFLESIKAEMEKLSNEEKVELEKNSISSIEEVVNVRRGIIITLRFPILTRTKEGGIAAMSYKDIEEVIDWIKEYK